MAATEDKLVTVAADGTVSSKAASYSDAVTTLLSMDQAVTGTTGAIQKVGLVVLGMAVQNQRLVGRWNPFGATA